MVLKGKNLIVFDFDWSFVDQDTDRWVLEVLSTKARRGWQAGKKEAPCFMPSITDAAMKVLWEEGITKDQILEAIAAIPLHPAMKRAVLGLKARKPDTKFVCLSNSNQIYINTILEAHGISDLFSALFCNRAHWDPTHPDRLLIEPYLPPSAPPHACTMCNPNMCKGAELDGWIRENGGWDAFDKIAHVGDGKNDFCPMVRLRTGDWAMVRKDLGLDLMLEEGKEAELAADVKRWEGAWEVDEIFQSL